MELYQLRTFVAVADEGSSTCESERLNACHPAVISQIEALEDELGVELFLRNAKGLEITPDGISLIAQAQKVLYEADSFILKARSLLEELVGSVKLGCVAEAASLATKKLFEHLKVNHPKLEILLEQGVSEQILDDIRSGTLDGGYILGQNLFPDELASFAVELYKLLVVGPRQWQDEIYTAGWAEIAALPWVWSSYDCPWRNLVEKAFAARELSTTAAAYVKGDDAMKSHVMAGAGMGLMPEKVALMAAEAGDICIWDKESFSVELSFAYLRGREVDSLFAAVLSGIKQVSSLNQ